MSATSRHRALTASATALTVVASTFAFVAASAPSAQAASCSSTYLSYGSRGTCVKLLQKNLGGLSVDGVYGSGTRSRVRSFQDDANIGVDGRVGPQTWRKLATYGKALGWKAGVTVYMCKESSTAFRFSAWNNSGDNANWNFYVSQSNWPIEGDALADDRIEAQGKVYAGAYNSEKLVVWVGRYGRDNAQTTTNVRSFSRNTLPACA
ncbi:peptidoglycan-binding domain-containing protein [Streptomyces sp. 4N124]|uniref:peptidoglycan-binding domain-containing protein n=1 Tax=Streptomyces sp. 4N124 TaxID=3457420 RepID=UPI003FD46FE8